MLTAVSACIAVCCRRFAEAKMTVVPVDKATGSYNLVVTRVVVVDDDEDDPDKLCTTPLAKPVQVLVSRLLTLSEPGSRCVVRTAQWTMSWCSSLTRPSTSPSPK